MQFATISTRKAVAALAAAAFLASCAPGAGGKRDRDAGGSSGGEKEKVAFIKNEAAQRVDVTVGGKLFTSLRWPDTVYKPVLYPILTASGIPVTRGFPIDTRAGERSDHRHQVGNWLNYGNVNGYDFWGNGSTGKRNEETGGQILFLGIDSLSEGNGEGRMSTSGSWVGPDGKELLSEKTTYHFIAADSGTRIIDRIATLTATGGDVIMKDTKEGMFGIRVDRQLELPSEGEVTLTDEKGLPTVKTLANENVSGNYRSSEGITGAAVWGTRAKWMDLYGDLDGEQVSLVICDHPGNPGYPTYWHAREYGLFAANPLGVKDFTGGKDSINFSVPAGESVTFRYRIVVASGTHLTDGQINAYAEDFAKNETK